MISEISYFYDWWLTDDRLFESVYAEYAELGCHRFGLPNTHMLRLLEEPDFAKFLKNLNRRYGFRFDGAHAHWSEIWDPNTVRQEHRKIMLKNLMRALEFTSEFEANVLVIHPGYTVLEHNPEFPVLEMRELAIQTFEQLLPKAEKLGVKIAIENNISPADTPEELLAICRYFESSSLGVCFDTGHAHMMAYAPEKDITKMHDFAIKLWNGKLQLYRGDALSELVPYILISHLHDNDGLRDWHQLPGDGTIDWNSVMENLAKAPRLVCLQNEACPCSCKASFAQAVRVFRKLCNRHSRFRNLSFV